MDSTLADMLIIGSSRANHHYVPSVFEDSLKISFYNAGRDGNGTFYQLALLKTILKRYTPKIIVFDYSSVFVKGAEEYDQMASLLPYYRTHKEIQPLVEMKSPFEKIKLLSEIYPFNSQLLTISVGNLKMNKKRVADDKGYPSSALFVSEPGLSSDSFGLIVETVEGGIKLDSSILKSFCL